MKNYTFGEMPHFERIRLGIKRVHSGEHMDMNFHDHRFSELTLIQHPAGAVHWAEGRSCALSRGDVILMHPGKLHAYEHTDALALCNILFEPDKLPVPLLDGITMRLFASLVTSCEAGKTRSPEKPIVHFSEEQTRKAEALVTELENELTGSAPGKILRSFALFIDLLVLICRADDEPVVNSVFAESVTVAVNHINRNYRENIDVSQLAKLANMSRRNFFRKFREQTGLAPVQYLNSRRLAAAEELLKNSNLPIGEIAGECGFCDSNYFSNVFRRHYGVSPVSFRNREKSIRTT